MRVVACVLSAALITSCATPAGLARVPVPESGDGDVGGAVAGTLLGVVAIIGVVALVAAASHASADADRAAAAAQKQHAEERASAARTERREHAWALTQQAEKAARDGNCGPARDLDGEVRAIDLDFHDTVFVHNVAIARCFAGSGTAKRD